MARATTGLSYLTFGIVVLGSLVFTVFVTIPQFGQYNDANAQLAQSLTREKENTAFLANLDQRAEELQKYSADAKALDVALPDKFVQSNLWVDINDMATKAGVTVSNIGESKKETAALKNDPNADAVLAKSVLASDGATSQTAPTTNAVNKLEKWVTTVKAQGNYSQIRTFIKNMENSLILSDLKEIKLSPASSSDKNVPTDALVAEMMIRTYVQP